MERPPRLVLTGAAGFLGKRLIERLARLWRIEAVDRDPPAAGHLLRMRDVHWHGVDIADGEALDRLVNALAADGEVTAVLHLAAHYDFTGERHPEYQRTNVEGTRLLLDACAPLGLERFFYASSLAACDFPRFGEVLDENSPPDGRHAYAESKRAGEEMMRAETRFPTAILRFAALYSDWCEYAPLYHFLHTWLSERWDSRILGGAGQSAVPYLHVRDATIFLERALSRRRDLEPAEVLIASPGDVVSHNELFRAATSYVHGTPLSPVHMPRPLAALGVRLLDAAGRWRGQRRFERPWMTSMIDRRLSVDPSHSHARLGWAPRARLEIVRRLPFLIENQLSELGTWAARNEAALHQDTLPPLVQLLRLFEEHEESIFGDFTQALVDDPALFPHYSRVGTSEHDWNHRQLLRNLAQSARTRHRGYFRTYCHDLAQRRARQGISQNELSAALATFERVCRQALTEDPRSDGLRPLIRELITRTVEFGLDGVEDAYEELGSSAREAA